MVSTSQPLMLRVNSAPRPPDLATEAPDLTLPTVTAVSVLSGARSFWWLQHDAEEEKTSPPLSLGRHGLLAGPSSGSHVEINGRREQRR